MSTANHYKFDRREIAFLLKEMYPLSELQAFPVYAEFSPDTAEAVLEEVLRFAAEEAAPLNASGDREGCKLVDGRVVTPGGFKELWKAYYEAGWNLIGAPEDDGGMGAPASFIMTASEIFSGANAAFHMYPGLAEGVAEVIEQVGDARQKEVYLAGLRSGRFGGTMCLTEPQAGSDVGSAKTTARRDGDSFLIQGTKIFISAGDQDFTDCILHLVLARIEGAPAGTKGLSLFIVPTRWVHDDGRLGEDNDVRVGGIEEKMGIHGNATCILNFGDAGRCRGVLLGEEGAGMKEMFRLMNMARAFTGLQGVALSSTAYLNALDYARSRVQGAEITRFGDPEAPRLNIIAHADVRRMLLDMKARVESMRALVLHAGRHWDMARALPEDDERRDYHQGQLDLLTPVIKAFCSDQAFRICETAVQTLGGYGYCADYPVEQYLRDAKIFSIYEGTNYIQSLDLVGRKLRQRKGQNLAEFSGDIAAFCRDHADHPVLGEDIAELEKASNQLTGASMALMGLAGKSFDMVALYATRYLELMGEVACGWLSLKAAALAHQRLQKSLDESHPDQAFYKGKIAAAKYYARNILPGVSVKCAVLTKGDDSALTMDDAGFSLAY